MTCECSSAPTRSIDSSPAGRASFELSPELPITLRVESARTEFSDAVPRLVARISARHPASEVVLPLRVAALLRMEVTAEEVLLRAQLLEVSPTEAGASESSPLVSFLEDVLRTEIAKRLAALPPLPLPIRHSLPLAIPPREMPLTLSTPAGSISGEVNVPGFHRQLELTLLEPVVLREGLHIFARTQAPSAAPAPAAPSEPEDLAELRARVKAMADSLRVPSSQIRMEISSRSILELVRQIGSVEAVFQSNHTEGQIISEFKDSFWGSKGWYVELDDPRALRAVLRLSSFSAEWRRDVGLLIGANYDLAADADLDVLGDPGPGGGLEIDLPVSASSRGRLAGRIEIRPCEPPARDDFLTYRWVVTRPKHLVVEFAVDVPIFGKQRFHQSFDNLLNLQTEGKVPVFWQESGHVTVKGRAELNRSYSVALLKEDFKILPNGMSLTGTAELTWLRAADIAEDP